MLKSQKVKIVEGSVIKLFQHSQMEVNQGLVPYQLFSGSLKGNQGLRLDREVWRLGIRTMEVWITYNPPLDQFTNPVDKIKNKNGGAIITFPGVPNSVCS